MKLGEKTDTGDLMGQIISTQEVPQNLDFAKITVVLQSFLGKRQQIPPMYSALKRDGKPLYKYAREGIEIERQPRDIEIFDIHLLSFENDIIKFFARVSKGTYVRTLGEEIAVGLGTLGHLISLRRVAIGNFAVDHAVGLEYVEYEKLIPMRQALAHLPRVEVDDATALDIKNGKPLSVMRNDALLAIIYRDQALAIYEKREDGLYYSRRGLF